MGGFGNDRITIGDDIRLLGKQPLVHQPGEKFTYGLNVDVIGYLVEILSGQKLDQFMKTRLFDPLGMEDTWFYLPEEKHSRLVQVNTEDANRTVIPMPQEFVNYPLRKGTYFSGGAGLAPPQGLCHLPPDASQYGRVQREEASCQPDCGADHIEPDR
jgi:CubicO group peptidase (beta-lactamase class C family)